jgi:hypothetical protein
MRRLRRTPSTPGHGRTASPRTAKGSRLEACTRAVKVANDAWIAASAVVEATGLQLENVLRGVDGLLTRVDPTHVALTAERPSSPEAFTPVATGTAPLDLAPRLRSKLARLAGHEDVAAEKAQLDQAEAQFRAALAAEKKAQARVELALVAELEAGEFDEAAVAPDGGLGETLPVRPQRVKRHAALRPGRKTAGRRAG